MRNTRRTFSIARTTDSRDFITFYTASNAPCHTSIVRHGAIFAVYKSKSLSRKIVLHIVEKLSCQSFNAEAPYSYDKHSL